MPCVRVNSMCSEYGKGQMHCTVLPSWKSSELGPKMTVTSWSCVNLLLLKLPFIIIITFESSLRKSKAPRIKEFLRVRDRELELKRISGEILCFECRRWESFVTSFPSRVVRLLKSRRSGIGIGWLCWLVFLCALCLRFWFTLELWRLKLKCDKKVCSMSFIFWRVVVRLCVHRGLIWPVKSW